MTAPITLATDRTNVSATGRATDLAGHVGTFKKTGINIDQNAAVDRGRADAAAHARIAPRPGDRALHVLRRALRHPLLSARPGVPRRGRGSDRLRHRHRPRGSHGSPAKTVNLDATPPVITITAPADGAVLSTPTMTITGTVTDAGSGAESVSSGALTVGLAAGGTFSLGPLALVDGANTFTLIGTDRAGNVRPQTVSVDRAARTSCRIPGSSRASRASRRRTTSSLVARRPTTRRSRARTACASPSPATATTCGGSTISPAAGQPLPRQRAPAIGRGELLRSCSSARWCTTPTARPT